MNPRENLLTFILSVEISNVNRTKVFHHKNVSESAVLTKRAANFFPPSVWNLKSCTANCWMLHRKNNVNKTRLIVMKQTHRIWVALVIFRPDLFSILIHDLLIFYSSKLNNFYGFLDTINNYEILFPCFRLRMRKYKIESKKHN